MTGPSPSRADRQGRPRRPRPRRQGRGALPAGRGHGGRLHGPAPDARRGRGGRRPGRRGRARHQPALRRPHDPRPQGARADARAGADDVRLVVGGVVPDEDVPELRAPGRGRRHPPGHAARRDRRPRPRARGLAPRPADRSRDRHGRSRPEPAPAHARRRSRGLAATLRSAYAPRLRRAVLAARDRVRRPRGARRADPGQAPRAGRVRVGALPVLPRASGRRRASRRRPSRRSTTSRASPSSRRPSCARRRPRIRRSATTSASSRRDVARIHGTSGTTGRPTVFGVGADDWARIAEAHARILWGAGHPPRRSRHDLLLLQPVHGLVGRARGRRAARRDGLPLRRRRRGTDADRGAAGRAISGRPRSTARPPTRCTSPRRRGARASIREAWASAILFFSGEPGAGIPATRRLIEETFGGICVDMGSMAEMTPWMTNGECRHRTGMHLWQDLVYTQVCDPETFEPGALRRRGHAGLHAPRAHLAAHDPARVGRPRRAGRTRPARAAARTRACPTGSTAASTT